MLIYSTRICLDICVFVLVFRPKNVRIKASPEIEIMSGGVKIES